MRRPCRSHCPVVLFSLGLLCAAGVSGVPLAPDGPELQVNMAITASQTEPAIAAGADGSFLVVWTSGVNDAGDIRARLVSSAGVPMASEQEINVVSAGQQYRPAVAGLVGGDFVVVWNDPSTSLQVRGRRVGPDGLAVGSELQISAVTSGQPHTAAIDALTNGGFVVVYTSHSSSGDDSSYESIQMRRFDAVGVGVGTELQVNGSTTGPQLFPDVAVGEDGSIVAVWYSEPGGDRGTPEQGLVARRFDSNGVAQGSGQLVRAGLVSRPRVAARGAGGGFVVTWDAQADGDGYGVAGRILDATGSPLAAEFQVNTYITGHQLSSRALAEPGGGFLVVWESGPSAGPVGQDGDLRGVRARRFSDDVPPVGGEEFAVNVFTTGNQQSAAVADFDVDHVLVTFTSETSGGDDDSGESIQVGSLLRPFFEDGFESGNTEGWWASVP